MIPSRLPSLAHALLLCLCIAMPARAESPALLSLGVGKFDAFKNIPRDKAADFRGEYRFGSGALLFDLDDVLVGRPWLGAEITSDGGLYGLGGIAIDLALGPLVLTPSFGAGIFSDPGGKEMGHPIEFRSGMELAWRRDDGIRIGAGVSHTSNAGLSLRNPGAEVVVLYLHIPTDRVWGD